MGADISVVIVFQCFDESRYGGFGGGADVADGSGGTADVPERIRSGEAEFYCGSRDPSGDDALS